MADTLPLAGLGLVHFDLPMIFRCAVELTEAAACLDQSEWADLPVDVEGPNSPHFQRWIERSSRLRRIEEESERLKGAMGASGPLGYWDSLSEATPTWPSYDQRFANTAHDRTIRLALEKLATAAIDLSGFATWREVQWGMHETGIRLLRQGLAQLWEGMAYQERSAVRDRLRRTRRLLGWPSNLKSPAPYDGPDEIAPQEQYRVITNYVTCLPRHMDDLQKEWDQLLRQNQMMFLYRATISQVVAAAEEAVKGLQTLGKRGYTSSAEYGDLYQKAFWALACLKRAGEIAPRETWPDFALEQRRLLSDSAEVLLRAVGGSPGGSNAVAVGDRDQALIAFSKATNQLRDVASSLSIPDRPAASAMREGALVAPATEPNLPPNHADDATVSLLSVFTNGLSDERILKASRLLTDENLTVNEKLTKIDALMPFPPTASAEQLGALLRVSKQAVLKTEWWTDHRKGEKMNAIGRRQALHWERGEERRRPARVDRTEGKNEDDW